MMQVRAETNLILHILTNREFDYALARDIDWNELYLRLKKYRMLPLAKVYYEARKESTPIPADILAKLNSNYESSKIQNSLQKKELLEVNKELRRNNVMPILLKSSAHKWRIYENPNIRYSNDIDILIPKDDIPLVKNILNEMGFRQSHFVDGNFFPADINEVLRIEAKTKELVAFVRKLNIGKIKNENNELLSFDHPFLIENHDVKYYSEIDIHWNLNFIFDHNEIVDASVEEEVDSTIFRYLSPEWEVIFAAYRLYYESFAEYNKGIHQYMDIIRLLKFHKDRIKPSILFTIVKKYKLEACFYYVFGHLQYTLLHSIPDSIRDIWIKTKNVSFRSNPTDLQDKGDFFPLLIAERCTFENHSSLVALS